MQSLNTHDYKVIDNDTGREIDQITSIHVYDTEVVLEHVYAETGMWGCGDYIRFYNKTYDKSEVTIVKR